MSDLVVIVGGKPDEPRSLHAQKKWITRDCQHKSVEVDEALGYVTCRQCKEKLNPMAVLAMLAKEESLLGRRIEEVKVMQAELDLRIRCKCQNCGKMTRIYRT